MNETTRGYVVLSVLAIGTLLFLIYGIYSSDYKRIAELEASVQFETERYDRAFTAQQCMKDAISQSLDEMSSIIDKYPHNIDGQQFSIYFNKIIKDKTACNDAMIKPKSQ